MKNETSHDSTRERILSEAEDLFAQKGYRAVSVREITKAAQSNLAAVNYHFGSKKNLYIEVFRSRWIPRAKSIHACFDAIVAGQDRPSPAGEVEALARAFMEGPLTEEERFRHTQLMTREISQPTEAFALVSQEIIQPFFKNLAVRLRPFMHPGVENEDLLLNILCIFGMVLYFNFARAAVSGVTGHEYDAEFKARLRRQIIDFSLGGLRLKDKEGPK